MSARAKGRVDLDATRGQLEQVGLLHAAAKLAELVEEAAKDDLPAHGFLDRLLAAESSEREMRRIATSLRLNVRTARIFPTRASIETAWSSSAVISPSYFRPSLSVTSSARAGAASAAAANNNEERARMSAS